MQSPYFRTDHYMKESKEMEMQRKIEAFFIKFAFWKKNKENSGK